jgi:hypothetical protein
VYFWYWGSAIDAIMLMIATTMISSTAVKPLRRPGMSRTRRL